MSDWVPLFQTIVWVALISAVLFLGRATWGRMLRAVEGRISQGDSMTLRGPLGLSAELKRETKGLPRIELGEEGIELPPGEAPEDMSSLRQKMGAEQRGVHLVHVVAPSDRPDQQYEVFAYLYGWKRRRFHLPEDLSDVARAEFFLGPLFTPSSVTVVNDRHSRIGFVTSTSAPALCLCRITFTDGHEVVVSRYLDFESGVLASAATGSKP